MTGRKRKNKFAESFGGNLFAVIIFAVMFVLLLGGLDSAEEARSAEAERIAEDSLRRAAISCYALEGRYPESYEYLKENYGVYVDEERYVVHYMVYASNLMPDIDVIRL
ncbi:MAG: hypothetical protein IJC39_00850 [Firmicutes bacterium]|nr:hypothetical protein [Bacillota bacterium]